MSKDNFPPYKEAALDSLSRRHRRRGDQLAVGRIRVEVCPSDRGLWWKVVTPGKVYRTTTQRDAIRWAVQWCRAEAAAGKRLTLKIKRPNGKIRDERTYPRSSDPKRSKG